jgi:hypothetical protein
VALNNANVRISNFSSARLTVILTVIFTVIDAVVLPIVVAVVLAITLDNAVVDSVYSVARLAFRLSLTHNNTRLFSIIVLLGVLVAADRGEGARRTV